MVPPIQRGARPAAGATHGQCLQDRLPDVCAELQITEAELAVLASVQATRADALLTALEVREAVRDMRAYPSLDTPTQSRINAEFELLEKRVAAAGLYRCRYSDYAREAVRYALLLLLSLVCLRRGFYCTAAVFFGLFWHQVTFVVHDAGHLELTHEYFWDTLVGAGIASLIGGLSVSWWKRNHNVHHVVTNLPEHDPDIQHMPLFAVSPRLLQSVWSSYYEKLLPYDAAARVMISIQAATYYPILCLGRFNLYRLSYDHLIMRRGPQTGMAFWFQVMEMVLIPVYWYWYGYLLVYRAIPTAWYRFCFVMITHIVTMPLHVQITLSHFAMSTCDLGPNESFPQRQLRTTMDVECPAWLDFVHGGLQFQAIHHLFPRLPRHRLREAQPFVREFCEKVGIEYKTYRFVQGNQVVISRLEQIAQQAKLLGECAKHMTMADEVTVKL